MSSLAAANTIPVTSAVMQENSRSSLRIRVIAAPLVHETVDSLPTAKNAAAIGMMGIPPTFGTNSRRSIWFPVDGD
jgi:hypothetical protein